MKPNYEELPLESTSEDKDDDGFISLRSSRKAPKNFIIVLLVIFLVMAILLVITFAVLYGVSKNDSSSSGSSSASGSSSNSTTSSPSSSTTSSPSSPTIPTPSPSPTTSSLSPSSTTSSPSPTTLPSDTICQTEACFDLSVQILASMDDTVNPCEDFYNFTCGNWDIYQHIRPGMAGYNTLTVQQHEVYDELADVLETDFAGGNQVLAELQDFYDSCITTHMSDEQLELQPIRDFYQHLGGWSLVNIPGDGTTWGLNSIQFIREKRLGSEAFYNLFIDVNGGFSEYTLGIEQSGLTLEYPELYNRSNSTDLEQVIAIVLTAFAQLNYTTTEIFDAAFEIAQFEKNLSQIWEDDDDLDDNSINSTVEDLYDLWPDHDWLTVLRGVLGPSGVDMQNSSIVTVVAPDYFRRLSSVISFASLETLENYAKWIATWQLLEVFLPDDTIRESVLKFKDAVMGKPSMQQREECVSVMESAMPIALGRVYAEHIFPPGSKEAGMELVTEVREGLRQRMAELDWLDDETRQLSIEKLKAIESRVAYPEYTFNNTYLDILYGELQFDPNKYTENFLHFINITSRKQFSLVYQPVDRAEFFIPPTTVNAYYFPQFNQITILEAIMQRPTFHKDWPLSIQYGALGTIVGHELTHGFDNEGRRYDKDGRKRMWWSQEAVQAFNERAQCFVEQYSNYEMFGISVDGNATLGENIADNGGIKASYNAFSKMSEMSQRLPGLTDFTNDQLFFIAFGQLWCSYTTEYSFLLSVLLDVHSPNTFRVLGSLMNNEDFAKAFSCPAGSPMNPQNKCELW